MIGVHVRGDSVLHRMPAGVKMLALVVALVVVVLLDEPWHFPVAMLVVIALMALTGVPARHHWAQIRPLRWVLPLLFAVQLLLYDWRGAVEVTGTMLIAASLAGLLIVTTPVTAILDVCQRLLRPLRRFGVDPDRVGLAMALAIRCIPLMTEIVNQVAQARKARGITGLRGSILALAAPAVVRALRAADAMGDALIARGVDD